MPATEEHYRANKSESSHDIVLPPIVRTTDEEKGC